MVELEARPLIDLSKLSSPALLITHPQGEQYLHRVHGKESLELTTTAFLLPLESSSLRYLNPLWWRFVYPSSLKKPKKVLAEMEKAEYTLAERALVKKWLDVERMPSRKEIWSELALELDKISYAAIRNARLEHSKDCVYCHKVPNFHEAHLPLTFDLLRNTYWERSGGILIWPNSY